MSALIVLFALFLSNSVLAFTLVDICPDVHKNGHETDGNPDSEDRSPSVRFWNPCPLLSIHLFEWGKAILEMQEDEVEKYQVVRVADQIVVDLMAKACGIDYETALKEFARS